MVLTDRVTMLVAVKAHDLQPVVVALDLLLPLHPVQTSTIRLQITRG